MGQRPFDVVVFGATGFTGRLTAEYFARTQANDFRWAIAGRSADTLEAMKRELATVGEAGKSVQVIEARVGEPGSLADMAAQTKVLLTTVGPYARFGEPTVRACVEQSTDYVDITGEPEFVDNILERWHVAAERAQVRIVNACGFDSIPHDLGVLETVRALGCDRGPISVEGFVAAKGGFSGGTWHSAVQAFGRLGRPGKPRRARQTKTKPLTPRSRPVRYATEVGAWVAPMPTIDPAIIRRSAQALPSYGPGFRYAHHMVVGTLPRLAATGLGVGAVVALSQVNVGQRLLLRLKHPGQGPSAEQRAKSWFTATFVGRAGGREVVTEVRGGDPGYGETSKMAAESALCLVRDRASLPACFGVLTPAVAMGNALTTRLKKAGIVFETSS